MLLYEWCAEDFMNVPSTAYMRYSYVIKHQSHNYDTPACVNNLPDEYADE